MLKMKNSLFDIVKIILLHVNCLVVWSGNLIGWVISLSLWVGRSVGGGIRGGKRGKFRPFSRIQIASERVSTEQGKLAHLFYTLTYHTLIFCAPFYAGQKQVNF